MKKIHVWFAALWVAIALSSFGTVAQAEEVYTVKTGDTVCKISRAFGDDCLEVCKVNNMEGKACDRIKPGQKLKIPAIGKPKEIIRKPVHRLADGSLPIAKLNTDPYSRYRTPDKDRKILLGRGYTVAEIEEYLMLRDQGKCVREEFSRGTKFPWMVHGNARVLKNLTAVWKQPETGLVCQLQSDRNVVILEKCDNLTEVAPRVSPPPPQVTAPEPEMIPPVHAKEGDTISCELQAGLGAYGNKIYQGTWQYAEGICYVFKDGEWQHGPGFYAMGGKGESRLSAYRNKERGVGVQYGVQRNFVTDDGDLATFEVKARLLYDQMSGKNLDAGYWVKQHGLKAGLYASYYERRGDDLYGVIGEYWHGFNQSVRSSWSGQQAQDRGSLGAYLIYEHQLSDDDKWRLRWIGGWQLTNWDHQNWLRLAAEFRYDETFMFGPQIGSPIFGISAANAAFSARDLTTYGGLVRMELRKQVKAGDADHREGQLEFIPAAATGETAKSPQ